MQNDRLVGMIGLARRAGKTVIGTEQICLALSKRRKDMVLVLISSSASSQTKKKITLKCEFYGVKATEISIDMDRLAKALGKTFATAAVAITDCNFAEAIMSRIREEE